MIPTERYQQIAQIMDEAYSAYEQGVIALRKRIVEDMRRKLTEAGVLNHPCEDSKARSGLRSPK